MSEQVFLAEGDVQVTRSRIVIANQTFPVTGVTSVRTETVAPNRQQSLICLAGGVILPFVLWQNVGVLALLVGIAILAAGVVLWRRAKPTYQLFLGTGRW